MIGAWIDDIVLRRTARMAKGPAAITREGMRTLEVDGSVIRLRTGGDGPFTIVFAPDPPNVIEHYDELFNLLAPHLSLLCFELPGFGLSFPKGGFNPSFQRTVETVARLLEALRMGPYVLALSCAAGLISLVLARDHPELVSKLVLIQTPSWPEEIRWSRRVDSQNLLGKPIVGQLLMVLARRKVAAGWYAAATPDRSTAEKFNTVAQERFDHGACYCLASAFQALRREPEPGFGALEQDALVIWGMADRTHRKTDKRSPLAFLPHAKLVEFEDAGHFPDLERPERFREQLLDFLGPEAGGRSRSSNSFSGRESAGRV